LLEKTIHAYRDMLLLCMRAPSILFPPACAPTCDAVARQESISLLRAGRQARAFGHCLLLCLAAARLSGQPHNGEIYRALLSGYVQQRGAVQFSGDTLGAWLPLLPSDSVARPRVGLAAPEIRYARQPDGRWARALQLSLSDSASGQLSRPLYLDTLDRRQLRRAIAASPPALQGKNPLPGPTFFFPAATICASMGLLLSLYYIRSR
jgi:hypothetical protein